jgi:hypothetical protein
MICRPAARHTRGAPNALDRQTLGLEQQWDDHSQVGSQGMMHCREYESYVIVADFSLVMDYY